MSLNVVSIMLGALLAASPALAGEAMHQVGPIVSENVSQGTFTIAEMGPWHGAGMRPVHREFHLTPGTRVRLAMRATEPGGFAGAYIEKPMAAADLRVGDYATVTVEREAGKLVATAIEVVRPGGSRMTTSPQASARPQPMRRTMHHTQ